MSDHIHKSHNKTLLLYHLVFPVKYRRDAISDAVGETLKSICLEISERFEIHFVEIGYESDHVHFLVQSVPQLSISKIVRIVKSITAKELFRLQPYTKQMLWGGNFWTAGFYANTVGQYASEDVIKKYIENQGKDKEYKNIHTQQLTLFGYPDGSASG